MSRIRSAEKPSTGNYEIAPLYDSEIYDDRRDDAQLGGMFEAAPDLVALASFKPLRWVRVNPAFSTVLGWAEHELIGQPIVDVIHLGDQERFKLAEAQLQESSSGELEIRLLCKGGGCRWIGFRIATSSDSTVFMGRDVTQTKRTLKHLRAASVRIQRENENLEQFVRTAGHDLQEPLRTVSMFSDLLMRRYGQDMPENSLELLLQIFGAANRMQALVRDLLIYARLSQEPDGRATRFKDVAVEVVF